MFRTAGRCRLSLLLAFLLTSSSAFAQTDLRLIGADVGQPTEIKFLVELPDDVSSANASDFQLIEDSRATAQASSSTPFRSSEWNLSAVMVIDTSGSVNRHVSAVGEDLADFVAALPPRDTLALVTFDDDVHDDALFDVSREQMGERLKRMRARGKRTVLYQALNRGLDLLVQYPSLRAWQRLIVVSDGADESGEESVATDRVIGRATAQRVAIDTIWLGPMADATRNTLVRLSERTGGVHTDALTPQPPADISIALNRLTARLNRAVVLSFAREVQATGNTQQVGISLTRPRTATGVMALQIPPSTIPEPRRALSEWVIGGVLALLALYLLYAAAYLLVSRFAPEHLALFPFKPWPTFEETFAPPPAVIPPPVAQPRSDRHTVVQRGPVNAAPGGASADRGLALEAIEGPLKGRRIVVNHARFQVGAGPNNDLRIATDTYLSNTHALFQSHDGQWLVSDQGSSNGTFVNGRKLTSGQGHALKHGQVVRMGTSEFRVVLVDEPAAGAEDAHLEIVR